MDFQDEYPLLSAINKPADIRSLDSDELSEICKEARKLIIKTVSENGGHLASNLGTVELTMALHKSFNTPDDCIVWDVGHQAYTHKLLTGRNKNFYSLRTKDGISGFVRPDESEHDSFYEGHAGTAVSQATGVAIANSIKGNKRFAVAVVGDGALGNGMVYEALNFAGSTNARLVVVLNDNEMSISKNVGAMARYLAAFRAKPEYYRFKAGTEKVLKKIPLVGFSLSSHFYKLKSKLKSIIYSSSFFEDLGFHYIGPIDGHDIGCLCEAFQSAKLIGKPVVIHINTIKGKGYNYAEISPEIFHGISRFDSLTGEAKSSQETFSTHFGQSICQFANKDKRICAVTAAMSIGTGLESFKKKYPNRFFDVGIAEEHAVTFSSGLAKAGMIPFFAVYSTFLQRTFDQLFHDGSLQRLKMIIIVDRAGFVGNDGETHHGLFDVSLALTLPNVNIYSPSNFFELDNAIYNGIYKNDGLTFIRYPRGTESVLFPQTNEYIDYRFFCDEPSEICVITYGRLCDNVCNAIKLSQKSINFIKLIKIFPVNSEIFDILLNYKEIMFYEESVKNGGVGQLFGCLLSELGYKGKYEHISVDNCLVPHSDVNSQLKLFNMDVDSMVKRFNKNDTKEKA